MSWCSTPRAAASSRTGTSLESGRGGERRILELRGELAPGTRLSEDSNPFALYELPAPYPVRGARPLDPLLPVASRSSRCSTTARSSRRPPSTAMTWSRAADRAHARRSAARAATSRSRSTRGPMPSSPPRRRCPTIRRPTSCAAARPARSIRGGLPASTGDDVDAIVRAVLDLDRSYLAVQGPPGTGKTYVGSHVIARLVREHGYKVGVVAQSHAVIENMLDRVVAAGVAARAGRARRRRIPARRRSRSPPIAKNGVAAFTAEQPGGFVVGGTAWDFSHEGRIPRGSLDLLVIDEAGQFSLASTIAVSLASPRLLLLGDPQQLPQVSQGTHPEPVDTSALGWVMDGADVIPPEYGYFLARTWRMHPAVAEPVSRLSYRGELAAHPSTALRDARGRRAGRPSRSRCGTTATRPSRPRRRRSSSASSATCIGRTWRDIRTDDDGEIDAGCRRARSPSATSSW